MLSENRYNAIVLTDEEGMIVEWNKKQVEITGTKACDIAGKYLWEFAY